MAEIKKRIRAVITGGGTGGHIYPALAIAQGLKEAVPDIKILYVGTGTGLEAEIVPKTGLPFKTITVSGLERRLSLHNLKTAAMLGRSFFQANGILRSFRPDVVIGTGGYVCGPVVLTACLKKIPTLIHEQNAFPGITNRILSRYVDKVCITFPEAKEHLFQKADIIETGLPVRTEIMNVSRDEAYKFFGLSPQKRTILVVGGSKGARSINEAVIPLLEWVNSNPSVQLIVVTGRKNYNQFSSFLEGSPSGSAGVKIIPYLERMDYGLAVADIVVSRAGASFLAEITAVGVPAILIPYPYASENHQEYNARSLEKRGAAKVYLEKEINGEMLLDAVKSVLHTDVLAAMAAQSRSLGKPEALSLITKSILQLLEK